MVQYQKSSIRKQILFLSCTPHNLLQTWTSKSSGLGIDCLGLEEEKAKNDYRKPKLPCTIHLHVHSVFYISDIDIYRLL